ncbi:hypothetical protein E4634_09530 [Mangrovimicrobium sediminis]|uniref:Ribosomal protein L7/L12 C-terminal domain-containing protein n=1 Tax=Mangrovimicrobium sediminis TaxID=2562682 RepID=A0A4Z0M4F2_9GAMM|nr:hypothetical protein [Haliea sp. SAOS-164]TGD74344.1 hypothetical protein E4634_09530 [Haliea sp. SAOS-164]
MITLASLALASGKILVKPEIDMPEEVIAEIRANRKVAAIKLLRQQQGVDLKTAKERVDAYITQNPPDPSLQPPAAETGVGRIVLLIIGVSVIFGIYRYFS